MTHKTRAIVLHKALFKESSFLVKLMTDDSGVVSALVQGARKNKSPFFSHFELGNCLEIVLLKKHTSDLSKITDSSVIKCSDISNYSYAQSLSIHSVLELFSQLIISDEESEVFFSLLLTFLDYIPTVKNNHLLIIWRFLIRLTELLGFPFVYQIDGKYKFFEGVEIGYTVPSLQTPQDWLDLLPSAAKYIHEPNILNKSCLLMNKLLLGWFDTHLQNKLHSKALTMYEEYVLS